jgi:hypothetical protein
VEAVRARIFKSLAFAVAGAAAIVTAGCGEYLGDQGRAPMQIVVNALEGAAGDSNAFGTTLASDVITMVRQNDPGSCTMWGDTGRVTLSLINKNQGESASSPTPLNQVTITRYRVEYLRSDRPSAVQGVDVPFAFESGLTFTVATAGTTQGAFTLVRNTAKLEAPLLALRNNTVLIQTIARVTFWGRDQAGNEVVATGDIGVTFGDFGSAC